MIQTARRWHVPETVLVPAGEFTMGSPVGEPGRDANEGPPHGVTIAKPFYVGCYAVTRGQFADFVSSTGYETEAGAWVWTGVEWQIDPQASWRNPGFRQDDDHPIVCVNWHDARAYASWLTEITGELYNLPSEAQWEYAARAGATTAFWWGSDISRKMARCQDKSATEWGTVAVGSFTPNPWGVYNMHGNAWEWCEDVWHTDYFGVPTDGSAWMTGGNVDRRVIRGGSWSVTPNYLRSASRYGDPVGGRISPLGFRIARVT
jgi:formylglycine-generating enzyme required for sulfatase activity